jgi:outer membrane receptor for ferrienterochelin and colicins
MIATNRAVVRSLLLALAVAALTSLTGADAAQAATAIEVRQRAEACAVEGQVVDATGAALPGAAVMVSGSDQTVVTAPDGSFCLAGTPGDHQVRVTLDGFAEARVRVSLPRAAPLLVTMVPAVRADVVVTATRTSRNLDDVPVRTEVIGRDLIVRSGARTLADAVEYTTGVRVENNCQNCNFSQIRLLGLDGPYTQILVDGQPVVSSLAQVYGIEQIPARMIERIEVVKGGGSALYGPGSVGGVVNIIPREPPRTGALVEMRSDTFGADRNLSLNGSADWVDGARRIFVTAFGQLDRVRPFDVDGDGFTEVSRRELQAGGLRLNRYQLEGRAKITVDLTHVTEDRRGGDSLHLPPDQALIAEAIDSRRLALGGTWFHSVSRRFDYRATLAAANTSRDSYYGTGRDPDAFGASRSRLAVLDTQLNHYAGLHTVSWGAQVSTETLHDEQPAYGRRMNLQYSNAGVYVQDDWAFVPRWQLLYGVRADAHTALASPVLSPRVALMHSPVPAFDIRVSAARGFRAPQVFDEDLHLSSAAGNIRIIELDPDLREERSTNVMAGFEWKPEAGPGQALIEINAFHTGLRDLFSVQEADDPATPVFEFRKVNFGRARVYGLEVNVGWGIGDRLVLQGGVVEQRARYAEPEPDFGSRDFFRTPRRYSNASLTWQVPRVADVFAAVRHTGSMRAPHYAGFIDEDRLESTPPFVVMDLAVSRTLGTGGQARLTLGVFARNLTNAYQPDLDRGPLRDSAYVYGPRFPRTLGVTLRVER